MTSKLLGIGLLSVGCMAAAAAGGFLALRPAVPEMLPELVQTAPVQSEPIRSVEAAQVAPEPASAPVPQSTAAVPPVEKTRVRPAKKMETAKSEASTQSIEPIESIEPFGTKEPNETNEPIDRPDAEAATAPAPTPPPAVPLPDKPAAVAPQAPIAVEPARYVPDAPPLEAAAVQESSRFAMEELTIEKHSVIGIRLNTSISTKTARVEDRVSATVSRDVTVRNRTAIPSDVRLEGTVTLVEHGGRFKNRPRLGLRFDRMILADGTRVSISTDTIYREGDSPTADSTAKVGAGAVAGAILGAVFGGKKGAAIGGAAGAVGGAAVVMKEDAGETSLPAGAPLTVRLTEDLVVTINR